MNSPPPIAQLPPQPRREAKLFARVIKWVLAFIALLIFLFANQTEFDWRLFSVMPHTGYGWPGILTAPLLHGSAEHLTANAAGLLILGMLAGSVYPKATLYSIPFFWIGSGLGAWLLGELGSYHIGASGLTHGLMFLILGLGILRRDRPAIATGMIAVFFYGGMMLAILPGEPGISWQSHLGGALGGLLGAALFYRADPKTPKRRYSWEDEKDEPYRDSELEPPSPIYVPVIWQRTPLATRGTLLRFPTPVGGRKYIKPARYQTKRKIWQRIPKKPQLHLRSTQKRLLRKT